MEHQARTVVAAPLSRTYNQWTQFETFPKFMEGVTQVQQIDDTTTRWNVKIAGVEREFYADITDQQPDRCISWRSRGEPRQAGRVEFRPAADGTEVLLAMDFEPEGPAETVADKLGLVKARVEADLNSFKEFIERRDSETGAWRGEVNGGQTQPPNLPPATSL